jgi:hypothetical protein
LLVNQPPGTQLGYDPAASTAELEVGPDPYSLTVANGTFNSSTVHRALKRLG